jgi:hypothetical protein
VTRFSRLAASLLLTGFALVTTSAGQGRNLEHRSITTARHDQAVQTFSGIPLAFSENRGEADPKVEYYVRGAGASVAFTRHGVGIALAGGHGRPSELSMELPGSRPVVPTGVGRTDAVIGQLGGEAPGRPAPTFSAVRYDDLWPGVDLVYEGTGSRLKYRFLVEPGADPSTIAMAWEGATALTVNPLGQLQIDHGAARPLIDEAPYSYQVVDGRRVEVATTYALDGRTVGFELERYDRTRSLVLDPALLLYAGFVGGSAADSALAIDVDGFGNAYLTGYALSTQTTFPDGDPDDNNAFPVAGFDQSHNGFYDAFVAKVDAEGTGLVYAGYIGGAGDDRGTAIAVDGSGSAYVAGRTSSRETSFPDGDPDGNDAFPVPGAHQTYTADDDTAFVAKVNPSGSALVSASYIGGDQDEYANGIAVDDAGNAYITGYGQSGAATFPDGNGFGAIPGADKTHNAGVYDAFVVKVNTAGTSFAYASYIGGSAVDVGQGVAIDPSGNAYVAGYTESTQGTFPDGDPNGDNLFPVAGFDQIHNGGRDAFALKLTPSGTAFSYGGYIGGAGDDYGFGIAANTSGTAYVTGQSASTQASFPDGDPNNDNAFPVPGPDLFHNGGGTDAFVAKIVAGGTALEYAGFIGGQGSEGGRGIDVHPSGTAYVTGSTSSTETSFPDGDPDTNDSFPGPDQTHNGGGTDAFVVKVSAGGAGFDYAGYIGGSAADEGTGVAVDEIGNAYVAGTTESGQGTFPDGSGIETLPGPDQTWNGDRDGFVAKVGDPLAPGVEAVCRGVAATLVGSSAAETLEGTSGADVIAGLGGNDTVRGFGGADLLCGGEGNDRLTGGGGRDKLIGDAGKDRLSGGAGKDRLRGGPGKDRCNGGGGKDSAACERERSVG